MPRPQQDWEARTENTFIAEQLDYDREAEHALAEEHIRLLTDEQRAAFTHIMESITSAEGGVFFLNGPGGAGKTFVYKTICHQAHGKMVLCVASSGIASLLLPGGRTAHSRFKIPVENLHGESNCNVPKESALAAMLRSVVAIIWDEAANQHRWAMEAVDRLLQDLRNDPRPFGGVAVV
ncbi:hypothetical protein L226DRAFT_433538, partial [Lentinus tigrinus ALCF2SS1-7]|uniref:uncharacterized protein n=1 Tax=Lentinus tigrinus ALCF2SS1-7 TaxID=1328758 RepID=UPI001165F58E